MPACGSAARKLPPSAAPSVSPPVRIVRRAGAAISPLASMLRSMVGTAASTVPPAARVLAMPSGVNLETSTRRAPLRTASRLTQMPKMKVRRSGTTTVSCAVRLRSRSSTASLPAIRSWPMTTPFGLPVLPEVKTIKAASRKSSRAGGRTVERLSIRSRSTRKRAPVVCWAASEAKAPALAGTGTTTPPASQMPSTPARSSGALAMVASTGSPGSMADRSRAMARAWESR